MEKDFLKNLRKEGFKGDSMKMEAYVYSRRP